MKRQCNAACLFCSIHYEWRSLCNNVMFKFADKRTPYSLLYNSCKILHQINQTVIMCFLQLTEAMTHHPWKLRTQMMRRGRKSQENPTEYGVKWKMRDEQSHCHQPETGHQHVPTCLSPHPRYKLYRGDKASLLLH